MAPPPSLLPASLLCLALAGCGFTEATPATETGEVYDPGETVNRGVFAANQVLDKGVLQPVARGYRSYLPQGVRQGVGNFAGNLQEPVVLANDLLQGNVTRAWTTARRFAVNTTIGVVGLIDVAEDWDLPGHRADFGQTFGVWGIGPGPAVQLPLLGPSNARDATGTMIGFLANPLSFIPGDAVATASLAGTGARVVDGRAELLDATDALEAESLDYYAALRSAQAQQRARLVAEGRRGEVVAPVTIIPPAGTP